MSDISGISSVDPSVVYGTSRTAAERDQARAEEARAEEMRQAEARALEAASQAPPADEGERGRNISAVV